MKPIVRLARCGGIDEHGTPRNRRDAQLEAGKYREARETALAGLATAPEDVELLVLAGRAGVELDAEDATEQLRRATGSL